MDSLNRTFAQLTSVLRSMSPQARIASGLMLSVVVIGLTWLAFVRTSDSYELLFGEQDLPRRRIGAMQIAFAEHGLNDCKVEGNRIRVPVRKKHEYLAALAKENVLPESFDLHQPAPKFNPFASRQEIETRIRAERENRLAREIERMPGIEQASVHMDEIKHGGFPATVEKRAIALVSGTEKQHLSDQQILAIRDTVSGFIAGLHSENVTVTDLVAMKAFTGNTFPNRPVGNPNYESEPQPNGEERALPPLPVSSEPTNKAFELKDYYFIGGILLFVVGASFLLLNHLRSQRLVSVPASGNENQPTSELRDNDFAEPTMYDSVANSQLNDGTGLREQLAEMVKQNPDRAADVLRNWIRNAA